MFANDLSKTISKDDEVILDLDNKYFTIEHNHLEESSLIESGSMGLGISSSLSAIRLKEQPQISGNKQALRDIDLNEICYEDIS